MIHFVLQQLDYIQYIDFYHERIKAFHVKDAEFNPTENKELLVDTKVG
jgi:sugar phosphate isomerase/epimerase